ncbi:MAG: DMT family transporter [Alphaproteobacteria bacterium]
MEPLAFFAVLTAAVLHASWNAIVKSGGDKALALLAVVISTVPPAIIALLFLPLPKSAAFPYLAAGLILHLGYQIFLFKAYRLGELTQVYPIARGIAPALVTLTAAILLAEPLSPQQLLATAIIISGIFTIAIADLINKAKLNAIPWAIGTGGFIAAYTLVDALGARAAQSPGGYFSILAILDAAFFTLYVRLRQPQLLQNLIQLPHKTRYLFGGSASYVAYGLVLWAAVLSPIALVSALRETSIVFALIIGSVFLGEKVAPSKIIASGAILGGVLILRLA